MKVNELSAKFDALTSQVGKIATEVAALKSALENVDLPADAVTALERLETAVKGVDDLNPDAPTPPPA